MKTSVLVKVQKLWKKYLFLIVSARKFYKTGADMFIRCTQSFVQRIMYLFCL